jgi:hypothetical protein
MDTEKLKHIQYISKNYKFLQGLLIVPIGIFFILIGLFSMIAIKLPYVLFIVALVFVLIFYMYYQVKITDDLMNYYRQTFGEVTDVQHQATPASSILMSFFIILPLILLGLMVFLKSFGDFIHNRINIQGLLLVPFAFAILYYAGPRFIVRIFAFVVLFSSFVLTLRVIPGLSDTGGFYLFTGVVLIIWGLLNHTYLKKHLQMVAIK